MDFRHLIVTCLFSMLRLSFETQKIKENYAIFIIEEPYFSNLIPIIFVFTFVYSIISYAFSKAKENNVLFFNNMIKTSCFKSDRGSDTGCFPLSLI